MKYCFTFKDLQLFLYIYTRALFATPVMLNFGLILRVSMCESMCWNTHDCHEHDIVPFTILGVNLEIIKTNPVFH